MLKNAGNTNTRAASLFTSNAEFSTASDRPPLRLPFIPFSRIPTEFRRAAEEIREENLSDLKTDKFPDVIGNDDDDDKGETKTNE
jgi:hypothetical protein